MNDKNFDQEQVVDGLENQVSQEVDDGGSVDPIAVSTPDEDLLVVKHADGRYVKGRYLMSFGMKRHCQNITNASRIRVNDETDEFAIELDDYSDSKDRAIYILHTMLTDWSAPYKPISKQTVLSVKGYDDLLERFVEEVENKNNLNVDRKAKKRKKKN